MLCNCAEGLHFSAFHYMYVVMGNKMMMVVEYGVQESQWHNVLDPQ